MQEENQRIQSVKKIPIPKYIDKIIVPAMGDYYSDYTVDLYSRPVCKCPLHVEDTPSMRWYEETNTFYCWGCRQSGDIISLHRAYTEQASGEAPKFRDSVNFLYKYFLEGQEEGAERILEASRVGAVDESPKSAVVDLIRTSNYINRLERKLAMGETIDSTRKMKLYGLIDKLLLLVKCNKINAWDAAQHIQSEVRRGACDAK